jgi:hypothetical protein
MTGGAGLGIAYRPHPPGKPDLKIGGPPEQFEEIDLVDQDALPWRYAGKE